MSEHLTGLLVCGIPVALYSIGTIRQLIRGQGLDRFRMICGAAGFAALAITLLSPLHHLSEGLFTAHMIEHELLMVVAAPLIVLAQPALPMLWGFPRFARRAIGKLSSRIIASFAFRLASLSLSATILHGAAIWIWHVPILFDTALASEGVHWLQHASFFFTALLFWWVVLIKAPDSAKEGPAVGHLFATGMHTGLLGALMTFSMRLWYPPSSRAADWVLTPLEDQQLAGLVMWIPSGIAYVLAALWLAGKWISRAPAQRIDYALGD